MANRILKNLGRIIGIIGVSFLIFLAILGGYLCGSMIMVASEAPDLNASNIDTLAGLKENSSILDQNGKLVQEISTTEYREIVPYDQIPKNLVNAVLAVEDKRFYEHNGVDPIGILAAMKDLAKTGDMRGASTITMQLARNVYLNNNVNWTRKIQEMYLALNMEKLMSKEEILESYLNRIFFGQNAYGVQAAAKVYFSKDVKDLDLAECASLVAVIPAPSSYALYSLIKPSQLKDQRVLGKTTINGENYVAVYNAKGYRRSKLVLKDMLDQGQISQAEYDQAISEDVASHINPPAKSAANTSTYVTDLIKEQAKYILMDSQGLSEGQANQLLMYGGLKIYSTIDQDLQQRLENICLNLDQEMTDHGYDPIRPSLKFNRYKNIVNRKGGLEYYKKEHILTEDDRIYLPADQFTLNQDGSLTIQSERLTGRSRRIDVVPYYSYNDKGTLLTHRISAIPLEAEDIEKNEDGSFTLSPAFVNNPEEPFYEKREDGSIALNPTYYTIDSKGVMQPQTAITILDTRTGEVRAVVGGREQQDSRHFLNRATQYARAPGSAIKPFMDYTGALALGYNAGSVQDDTPFEMTEDNNPWPRNDYGHYKGLMNMKDALAYSSNPIAVKWLNTIGMEVAKEYMTRYGFINRDHPERDHFVEARENGKTNDENLSAGIGGWTEGVTSLEMASAIQAIGNNGQRIQPSSISKIVDNHGKIYYENRHEGNEVLAPAENYQLLDILKHVVEKGYTRNYISTKGIETIGKTGTTNYKTNFWFVGANPYYSTAVWVGADNNRLSMKGSSNTVAAALYDIVSDMACQGKEAAKFEVPEGVYQMEVCSLSGGKPTEACYADHNHPVTTIWVSDATAPKTDCSVHVLAAVDSRNNLLAGENTPREVRIVRSFIKRPTPYHPDQFGGILPRDWEYELPTGYSGLGSLESTKSESSSTVEETEDGPSEEKPPAPRQPAPASSQQESEKEQEGESTE